MNPKTIFISAFFLFASALCLRAQGTYEYATVTYTLDGSNYYIGVSTGDNHVETKVKFDSKGYLLDLSPALQKVNELAKEGWEVFSTAVNAYHLRRKKP